MKSKLFLFLCLLLPIGIQAQQHQGQSRSLQASNLLNPNISAIGWIQSEVGHRNRTDEDHHAFDFKELEIGFQSVVDGYAQADLFLSLHDGNFEIEEGYINWFRLPYETAIKAGKFRTNISKFNKTHGPESPFATRPFVHEAFFGEEGFAGTGGSLSWHVPNPMFFTSLDVDVINTPEQEEVPAFEKAEKGDLTYVGRLGSFFDFTESANITIGLSGAIGAAGQEYQSASNSSDTLKSQIYGFDVTFRWKNPRQAIYRSFIWQTEMFWSDREVSSADSNLSRGLFSYMEYQFLRRWRAGIRYDYTEALLDNTNEEQGGLLYLTFDPSEFSRISLQGQHKNFDDDTEETLGFLKIIFNIGPHGSHPF